jgi:hypothetical protein
MAANTAPIFSRLGSVHGGTALTNAANDYNGVNINNQFIFDGDETNGSFIQKLRFKPLGTNVASVARVYVNNGNINTSSSHVTQVTGLTAATATTGGTLRPGTYFGIVQAVDSWGGIANAGTATTFSSEVSRVVPSGTATNTITWSWNAVDGAAKYRVFVGTATSNQYAYFETTTNSFVQTVPFIDGADIPIGNPQDYWTNQMFIGEVSLPVTTASLTAALPDIDYVLNIALPPKHRILVGLSTTGATSLASGWAVTGIGGIY